MQNWRERISVNPAICHGRACIRRTRVMVSLVLDDIAAGVPRHEIFKSYPVLTEADMEAALAYAAELAREGTVDLPLETSEVPLRRPSKKLFHTSFESHPSRNPLNLCNFSALVIPIDRAFESLISNP
jgi:uncharacterized protein (DUF433 family)